ncbi:MAG: DUF2914 domain-containing protein [Candidatus Methylomirabilales bacterium]
MGTWKKAAALTVVGLLLPILALSQQYPMQDGNAIFVTRDALTTGVVDREPIDDASNLPPAVGELYYFTEVKGANDSTYITHVWYYEGREMAQVPLSVNGPRWRTWSTKQMMDNWRGSWKVEAVDSDGNILSSQNFDLR